MTTTNGTSTATTKRSGAVEYDTDILSPKSAGHWPRPSYKASIMTNTNDEGTHAFRRLG
jgi:hypothetical protein